MTLFTLRALPADDVFWCSRLKLSIVVLRSKREGSGKLMFEQIPWCLTAHFHPTLLHPLMYGITKNMVPSVGSVWCDNHGYGGHITSMCKGIPRRRPTPSSTPTQPPMIGPLPMPVPPPVPSSLLPTRVVHLKPHVCTKSLPNLYPLSLWLYLNSSDPSQLSQGTPSTPWHQVTPPKAKLRHCKYCDSTSHPYWQCSKLQQGRVQYCFLCGQPGHRSGQCPNLEFDQSLIDNNHQKFLQSLALGQQFVPLQDEPPIIKIHPSSGSFSTQVLADLFGYLRGLPQDCVLKQDSHEICVKYPSKDVALQAFNTLQEINTIMVSSTYPLVPKPKQEPLPGAEAPSSTTMVTTTKPMELDLPNMPTSLTSQRFQTMEHDLAAMQATIRNLQAAHDDNAIELKKLQATTNTTQSLLEQILDRLPAKSPTKTITNVDESMGSQPTPTPEPEDNGQAFKFARINGE